MPAVLVLAALFGLGALLVVPPAARSCDGWFLAKAIDLDETGLDLRLQANGFRARLVTLGTDGLGRLLLCGQLAAQLIGVLVCSCQLGT